MGRPEATSAFLPSELPEVVLRQKLAASTARSTLSQRRNRLIQISETPDGDRFVTRRYSRQAVRTIQRSGLSIRQAWNGMHAAFAAIGTPVVSSALLETDGTYPYTAIGEYVPDGTHMRQAPVRLKTEVAQGLGQIISNVGRLIPSPQMFAGDMYLVRGEQAEARAELIDTDPLMLDMPGIVGSTLSDTLHAGYLRKIGTMLYREWTDESDREQVIGSFEESAGQYVPDLRSAAPLTFDAFADVIAMKYGVDPSQLTR